MKETLRIVFAGGGTGGHIFPALNMAQAIAEHRPAEFIFFGTNRGLEARLVPQAGYRLQLIPVAGLQRRLTLKNLTVPWKLAKSMRLSRQVLKKFKPHLVIGTGGYVMGPVLKTAQRLKIPTVLQEQNSFPGVTTRLLAKKAKLVLAAYREVKTYLPQQTKVLHTGNPIRAVRSEKSNRELWSDFGLQPELPVVLVFGGSQGAHHINLAVKALLEKDVLANYQLLWQTGRQDLEEMRQFVKSKNLKNVQVLPFIDDMPGAYKLACIAVCRSGAMTISELIFHGVPALLIPLASAAGNHQYKNALAIEEQGAAITIADNRNLAENLYTRLKQLLADENTLQLMGEKMQGLYQADTYEKILSALDELLEENGIEAAN